MSASTISSRPVRCAAAYPVKVLGDGGVSVALQVSAHAFSAAAREKLSAAGGTAIEI